MALGIDPTIDYAFKRLFGDPNHVAVLVHLLNAIFEGVFQVGGVEILTPFLEKDFEDDKLAVLDLRVRDTQGRTYILEMQTALRAGLPSRLVYYLSATYSEQLREGESYAKLAPAICICFLNQEVLPSATSFHTRFRLCSLEEHLVLTDQLEVHLVELPKYNGAKADLPQARPKERWAYFMRHAAEMTIAEIDQFLPEPAFVEAGGVLDMISKSPEERLRYEMRIKAMRDLMSNLEAAREEGLEQGIEKGIEQGIEKGIEKGSLLGRIQTLQELLGDIVLTSQELQTWEVDRLRRTAESLQARLRGRAST
jgi:predicted transposase/invertase (TIGR01784 family)